ncbi:MAG: hypothetical protein JWP91_1672 [Fibrobacteres bacterium]|nr:hypothetical protein [Fibrobacterota bacterium]
MRTPAGLETGTLSGCMKMKYSMICGPEVAQEGANLAKMGVLA